MQGLARPGLHAKICVPVWSMPCVFIGGERESIRSDSHVPKQFTCTMDVDGVPVDDSLTVGIYSTIRETQVNQVEKTP